MRTSVAMLACVPVILVGASVAFGQGTTLQYRWIKGDDLRYRFTVQGSTTMSGMPGVAEMQMEQTSVQVVRLKVLDVAADGSATLSQTVESMRMEMSTQDGKTVFDSAAADTAADSGPPELRATLAAMLGEPITITMAPTGAVIKVEGLSRIVDKMMKTIPQGGAAALFVSQLKAGMTDEAVRSTFSQGFVTFPDHAVTTGGTWTGEFPMSIPNMGTLSTSKTSTLVGIESNSGSPVARIATAISMRQVAPSPQAGPMGMTFKIADCKGEGEVLFDIAKGRVLKSSYKSDMPMTMSMPSPGGEQVNVKSLVRSTATMEIVDK